MAKKKGESDKKWVVVDAEPVSDPKHDADSSKETVVVVEDELELLQVDLGDMVKVKQVLDEAVAAAVLEHVPEDYRWENFKLGLMTAACVFAMIAQFAPLPFPESRPVLGLCGALYFTLSGILQLITTYIDKDAILLTKPVAMSKHPFLSKHGIRVRSSLPRFSEFYTVTLEFQLKNTELQSPFVTETWSVGKFFDKEGYFDEVGLTEAISALFKRLEGEKYDKQDTKSKKE